MADGLLNKASIILTPTGYKAGTLYNVAPVVEPYEDFDFARTSTATRINSSGLVSNVATGVPRISYDSNGENGHILLEPTSTNLFDYSEDFSQWTNRNVPLVSSSIVSPEGTNNATELNITNGSGHFLLIETSVDSSKAYTFSFYVKRGTATALSFRIRDITNSADIIAPTSYYSQTSSDWQRVDFTFTTPSTCNSIRSYVLSDGGSTGTVFIWGAQLEELPYATSYIPTLTGSLETRATETANGAGSADLINSSEGVLYAEIAALSDVDGRWISLSNGTTNQRVSIAFQADDIRLYIKNASGLIWDYTYTSANIFNYNKIALKYKGGDYALWINGTEVSTDSNSNLLSGLNSLQFDSGGGSSDFYGKCKALAVFNEALSDAELNNLTG